MKLIDKYKNDKGSLSLEEKKELLDEAKDAYYNTSTELLSDIEYDALEKSIGYENKSYIGSRHSENYTIHHPIIMGSLSKVQIHQAKDGSIDWSTYFQEIKSYINKYHNYVTCLVTPKYDGCSFEVVLDVQEKKIISISGRGDGEYGKDMTKQLRNKFSQDMIDDFCTNIDNIYNAGTHSIEKAVLRGEVLVSKNVFKEKYTDDFANPRAFVAGMLNRDDENLPEYDDLSLVIYDMRLKSFESPTYLDFDWTRLANNTGYRSMFPDCYDFGYELSSLFELVKIYNKYEEYRQESEYAQDGIVVKPIDIYRENNTTERRPADCIAIKYTPMTEPTTVRDIEWKLGKTGEWIPTIVTDTVKMDGKNINRASAFNYGYLMEKCISISTKVVLSLAGDIIPFIYKIEDKSGFDEKKLGTNFPASGFVSGVHLMEGKLPADHTLLHSAMSLNIPGFGESNIKKFIEWKKKDCEGDEFFGIEAKPLPEHILLCKPNEIKLALGGKTGDNVAKAYEKILVNMNLKDIITSCNFKLCGEKVATQIYAKLIGEPYDFTSMASEGYSWVDNPDSEQMLLLMKIFNFNGWSIDTWKLTEEQKTSLQSEKEKLNEQIPVILTGEPNKYSSKVEFLKLNPQYRLTGSWKEVKIVFTNSLESNTGKMKKAREKNIEIKVY